MTAATSSAGNAPRSKSALKEPGNLKGFPGIPMKASQQLYRSVTAGYGAWWFSSEGGRFDLPSPNGTCYLSTDVQTAVREKLGETINEAEMIPATAMDAMEVVELHLPEDVTLANTGDASAANYGAFRELATYTDDIHGYAKTCRWATAFHDESFEGILYESRFTSITEATAIALFGEAEARSWSEGVRMPGEKAFELANMLHLVERIPSLKTVHIAKAPNPL